MRMNKTRFAYSALLCSVVIGGCSDIASDQQGAGGNGGAPGASGDSSKAGSSASGGTRGIAGSPDDEGGAAGEPVSEAGAASEPEAKAGSGGLGGGGGVGGAAGHGVGGSGAPAGNGGVAGGAGNAGGSAVACGTLGGACCAGDAAPMCSDMNTACLGGASCSCVRNLFDFYLLRVDGKLLVEPDSSSGAQTPVLDATTALAMADVKKAVGGGAYGCAMRKTNDSAWCWRAAANGNNAGQLGSGAIDSSGALFRATPVLISVNRPLTGVTDIVSNIASSTCAIGAGGKVYCWGDLTWLSNGGTGLQVAYATQITTDGVTPLTNVQSMAFGTTTACAIVAGVGGNEAWCWGRNNSAQLGQGDTATRRYPTKVLGLTNPTRIAVTAPDLNSGVTVCAVDGGNVRCWGSTSTGGTGKTGSQILSPTLVLKTDAVTPLSGIVDIRPIAPYNYAGFCALTANHTPFCWGQGFGAYPDVYLAPNLVDLGYVSNGTFGATVRYLSSDGLYHIGGASRAPDCGVIQ